MGTSKQMQAAADTLQPAFGKVGDQAAGASLQAAKEFAGTLEHAAEKGQAVVAEIEGLEAKAAGKQADDQSSEGVTAALQKATASAKAEEAALTELKQKATVVANSTNASALY